MQTNTRTILGYILCFIGTPFDLKNRKILVSCNADLAAEMSSLIEDFDVGRD